MEMKSLLNDSDDDDSEVDIFETTNLLANNNYNKRGSAFESSGSKRGNQRKMGNILKSLCCG